MDYTQITGDQVSTMLAEIGTGSIDDLFVGVPADKRVKGRLDISRGLSEPELMADLKALANRNVPCDDAARICFLGAGAYDHFSPAVVDYLGMQSEFLTAYTPYQAEASQGSLQAFYEFQTMICQLTGMDVANASLYEQAVAVAEAVLTAVAITRRSHVLVSDAIHPDARAVLQTLMRDQPIEIVFIEWEDGRTCLQKVKDEMGEDTAAVVVQSPNFLGVIERVADVASLAHDAGALVIQSVDPISCGLLKRPGDLDVDIVVGEGQSLGIPLAYGGPYLGFFACREKFLRKMPGRVVGMTRDAEGRRAFCLTLQTREQHIKRERATSNVCTNQGLLALRAAVHLAALGRDGIHRVSRLCADKAHYAADEIGRLNGYQLKFATPFFREFVVQCERPVVDVLASCRKQGILAGVPVGRWHDDLADCLMVAVTEQRTKGQIDALVDALDSV